jgi:predicted nucleic acid-binding protein
VILPDVNILVHAFRSDSSDHGRCRSWLDGVVNGDARYGMAPQVLSGVIRITTHPKVFVKPSSKDEVLRFCNILLAQSRCVVIQPVSGTGRSSRAFARKRMFVTTWYLTHGLLPWPWSPAVSGSLSIAIMRGSRAFDGACRRDAAIRS